MSKKKIPLYDGNSDDYTIEYKIEFRLDEKSNLSLCNLLKYIKKNEKILNKEFKIFKQIKDKKFHKLIEEVSPIPENKLWDYVNDKTTMDWDDLIFNLNKLQADFIYTGSVRTWNGYATGYNLYSGKLGDLIISLSTGYSNIKLYIKDKELILSGSDHMHHRIKYFKSSEINDYLTPDYAEEWDKELEEIEEGMAEYDDWTFEDFDDIQLSRKTKEILFEKADDISELINGGAE